MSWASSTITLGGDSGGGPCGACKFLRRKCMSGCIFAPYFNSEQGEAQFTVVHKVFGASNVSKLLLKIPTRLDSVVTICYEAQARLSDPIYGCVNHTLSLEQQVVNLQDEVTNLRTKLATLEQPVATKQMQMPMPTPFSISDLSSASIFPSTIELSTLLDTSAQQSSALPQQHQNQHYQPSYQT